MSKGDSWRFFATAFVALLAHYWPGRRLGRRMDPVTALASDLVPAPGSGLRWRVAATAMNALSGVALFAFAFGIVVLFVRG